ncbi:quinone oxidoreductase family protein [Acetobacter senegalensis]|uniref:quinone oxidoreductase family protein n=1 Tax=Acetobacter senegalensis TaxID=446692 RepID=UPI00264AAC1A|nr:quinone oxidoreductase [Acetobacter senegalensis]MDN7356253.1 quinone oxidoreductase [Acetobacter senegalensis]
MTKAVNHVIQVSKTGGTEVLHFEALPVPQPGPREVLIRQHAVGVNFVDTYFRSGLYKFPSLPGIPGMEGAGTVEAVGHDVSHFRPGMRVAYANALGAYAEFRTISEDRLVQLPDTIGFETAAAVMLRGLTVHMLLCQVHKVQKSDTVLVYAAAGGVGQLMCQWARHLGVRVIGVTSTAEKAELARASGASEVIIGTEGLPEKVSELTQAAMVPVVYDSIGRDTFETSLKCLAPKGLMVSYGNASGPVTGVDLGLLAKYGSLFVTRPVLWTYIDNTQAFRSAAAKLFALLECGEIKVDIGQRFALKDVAKAHDALQSGKTTGSTILTL